MIFFPSLAASGSGVVFRRIEYFDAKQKRTLVFLTNHLELGTRRSAIYQVRGVDPAIKAASEDEANALKIRSGRR